MSDGSNRLPILLEAVKNASVVFAKAERIGAEAAYDMGVALVEAKSLCQHGEWTGFLEQAGVTPRSAQRYMRVVKSGMDREYVAMIGLSDALEEIDRAQKIMPDSWTATMAVFKDEDDPSVFIWWRVSQFDAGFIQVYRDNLDNCGKCYIVEKMPLYLVGFMYQNYVDHADKYPEIRRHTLSFAERDRKIAFLREELRKHAEGAAA